MSTLIWNGPWMVWNVALALVPIGLAWLLFRHPERAGVTWWAGLVAFVVFLPNAAYVITDLVHLPGDLTPYRGHMVMTLAVVGQYALLVAIGLAAYTGSLVLLRRDLQRRGASSSFVMTVELGLHALCAVGVLLGRYARFNSWDMGTRPGAVAAHLGSRLDHAVSWGLLIGMFLVLVASSFVARAAGAGLAHELRELRARWHR